MLKTGNLYEPVNHTENEFINELLSRGSKNLRIEHIVSQGHISPENFYYDQSENEFVAVLQGRAKLEFFSSEHNYILEFKPGDWVIIPAHVKHRVIYTSSNEPCIWLAVFWRE